MSLTQLAVDAGVTEEESQFLGDVMNRAILQSLGRQMMGKDSPDLITHGDIQKVLGIVGKLENHDPAVIPEDVKAMLIEIRSQMKNGG